MSSYWPPNFLSPNYWATEYWWAGEFGVEPTTFLITTGIVTLVPQSSAQVELVVSSIGQVELVPVSSYQVVLED